MKNEPCKMKVIITGGHMTPALAVLDELLERGVKKENILWVGHKFSMIGDENTSAEYNVVTDRGIKFQDLIAGKLYRKFSWNGVLSLLRIPVGFFQAFFIVTQMQPNFVMSFGGYLAVPVAFWAWLMGTPVYTHEQTVVIGRANKVLQFMAKKVFFSWENSLDELSEEERSSGKFILTGNPVRKEIFEKKNNKFDFNNGKKTIYITGGNQGSHIINEIILKSLPQLLQKYNVIHQCGSTSVHNDVETLTSFRESLSEELKNSYIVQTGFWDDDIGAVFANSDLIVSRSGANIVTEILSLGKTSVLIPIPWTAGDEQTKNAEMVEKMGRGILLKQDVLEKESLLTAIEKAFSLPNKEPMKFHNSAKMIVDELLE